MRKSCPRAGLGKEVQESLDLAMGPRARMDLMHSLDYSLFHLWLQLHPTGTCRALSPHPCQQRISSRPCTHSQLSCSAWLWNSSSGFTPITLCMACRFQPRRITTGAWICPLHGTGRADRSALRSQAQPWRGRGGGDREALPLGWVMGCTREQGCLAAGARL